MKRRLLTVAVTIASAAFLISSCIRADKHVFQTAKAKLMVVHASPDAGAVGLTVDTAVQSILPLSFGSNTDYIDVKSGKRNLFVTSYSTGATVLQIDSVPFVANKFYSLFVVDTLANLNAVVLEDSFSSDSVNAYVRFLNLSPDVPSAQFGSAATALEFGQNLAFKSSTAFFPLSAGNYVFNVRTSSNLTLAQTSSLSLQNGRYYTVYLRGLFYKNDGSFGLDVIANK